MNEQPLFKFSGRLLTGLTTDGMKQIGSFSAIGETFTDALDTLNVALGNDGLTIYRYELQDVQVVA